MKELTEQQLFENLLTQIKMKLPQVSQKSQEEFIVNLNNLHMLHLLVRNNCINVLPFFLTLKLDVNGLDADGNSPLMIAGRKGYRKIVDLLVENYNADLFQLNNNRESLLDIVAKHSPNLLPHIATLILNRLLACENTSESNLEPILKYVLTFNPDLYYRYPNDCFNTLTYFVIHNFTHLLPNVESVSYSKPQPRKLPWEYTPQTIVDEVSAKKQKTAYNAYPMIWHEKSQPQSTKIPDEKINTFEPSFP